MVFFLIASNGVEIPAKRSLLFILIHRTTMTYKCETCGREADTQENCHDKPMQESAVAAAEEEKKEETPA
jgi:hypothetical protein